LRLWLRRLLLLPPLLVLAAAAAVAIACGFCAEAAVSPCQ